MTPPSEVAARPVTALPVQRAVAVGRARAGAVGPGVPILGHDDQAARERQRATESTASDRRIYRMIDDARHLWARVRTRRSWHQACS